MNASLLVLSTLAVRHHVGGPRASTVRVPGERVADPLVALRRRPSPPPCPHCAHERIQRWGRFGLRQRYRCSTCGRTFSDFTGSALYRLRRADLWPEYCRCVLEGQSVRRTARRLGVHRDTAFRWRHRLLREIRADETHRLGTHVHVADTFLAGRRRILVALDDRGRALAVSLGSDRVDVTAVRRCLAGRLEPGATLVTIEGKHSAVARFACSAAVEWRQRRHVDPRYDRRIETVPSYGFRLRRWLERFRGIAPHYTENYLSWFRLVDRSMWRGALLTPAPASARSLAVGLASAPMGLRVQEEPIMDGAPGASSAWPKGRIGRG